MDGSARTRVWKAYKQYARDQQHARPGRKPQQLEYLRELEERIMYENRDVYRQNEEQLSRDSGAQGVYKVSLVDESLSHKTPDPSKGRAQNASNHVINLQIKRVQRKHLQSSRDLVRRRDGSSTSKGGAYSSPRMQVVHGATGAAGSDTVPSSRKQQSHSTQNRAKSQKNLTNAKGSFARRKNQAKPDKQERHEWGTGNSAEQRVEFRLNIP